MSEMIKCYKTRFFRKTGRHFDEVEELLKKIGDEK